MLVQLQSVMDDMQIDYAPPIPSRRRTRRLVFAAALLLILVSVGWKAAPLTWHRVQLLYCQRQAMRYSPPLDQIVYDNGPEDVRKLVRSPEYDEDIASVPAGAYRMNRVWWNFCGLYTPPGRLPEPVLFLHQMRNSRGEIRLVAVERGWPKLGNDGDLHLRMKFQFQPVVLRPGALFSNPTELTDSFGYLDCGLFMDPKRGQDHVRWYAGQADPADPSHFTIQFELNGNPNIVDGWLRDDDQVVLERRGSNVTSPSPWSPVSAGPVP